ncbi:RTA1 like protein-domain-containing protein [Tricladium varicosporioides]|nr:RTA1 like protein-domain-containing protein [Hymenoscyphus varicosporioides]
MSNLTHSSGHGTGYGNKTLLMMPHLCTLETCDLSLASFDYLPTVPGNGIFAGIFALFAIIQLFFGIKYKTWGYMSAMIIGLIMECVGYIARIMVHNSPFNNDIWLIYLILLTIAPAFLTAAIYLCLARIVTVYGESLSRFKPRTYTLIFCTCDFISLVLQGAGGGIASTANTTSSRDLGKNMMLAGLIFQVVSLVLFAICCGEFAFRVKKGMGNRNPAYVSLCSSKLFKGFLWGLFIASFTILVRSAYRCVELAGGFDSNLFRGDEAVFMILEGAMIVIATGCLTFLHPGLSFQGAWGAANFSYRTKKNKADRMSSSDEEMGNVELSDVSAARK